MIGVCSIDGCGKHGVITRALCTKHYQRWRARGTTTQIGKQYAAAGEARFIDGSGYVVLAYGRREHVIVAEKALGKTLPKGACVHHWNEDKTDNRHENLLICTQPYHQLIHRRMRAMDACGNPAWAPCRYCCKYDDPQNFTKHHYHQACKNAYDLRRYHNRRKQEKTSCRILDV